MSRSPTRNSSSAIGTHARFRSTRLPREQNGDDRLEDRSSQQSDHEEISGEQEETVEKETPRPVSEQHKSPPPFASLRHRFSARHSSAGFLVNPEKRRQMGAGAETANDLQHVKGKKKENGNAFSQKTPQFESLAHSPNGTLRARPKFSIAGSFRSHDVRSNGSSTSRKSAEVPNHRAVEGLPTTGSERQPQRHRTPNVAQDNARRTSTSASHSLDNSPAIDPAQIVRMAINLSEGRRMHLDPSNVPSIPSSTDRRAVSATIPARPNAHEKTIEKRGSAQDRSSKAISTGTGTDQQSGLQPSILSSSSRSTGDNTFVLLADEQPEFTFSPATLIRAERAKAFIELAHEHRRLLHYLPPLRHSRESGEGKVANNLGREYNPIQYLRNRDARDFRRANINSERSGWQDVHAVRGWIGAVERESDQKGYLEGDIAHLPQWVAGTGLSTNPNSDAYPYPSAKKTSSHQPLVLSSSFWATPPSDLLADAYWLEQDDHKALVRDRVNRKIFKQFSQPTRRRTGTGTSAKTQRMKYDVASDEKEDPARPNTARFTDSPTTMDDEERRELDDIRFSPQHKSRTIRVKRHLFGKRGAHDHEEHDRSGSDSGRESIEGFPTRRGPKNTNIGPLERHMKLMIEKERRGQASDIEASESIESPEDVEGRRRGGVSEASPTLERHQLDPKRLSETYRFPQLDNRRGSSTDTPRISIEDHDAQKVANQNTNSANGHVVQPTISHKDHGEPVEIERVVNRASRLGFLRRHKHPESRTAERDFAARSHDAQRGRKKSFGSTSRSEMEDQFASPEVGSAGYASSESLRDYNHESHSPQKGNTSGRHFFKAGRIGEMMRSDKREAGKIDTTLQPGRHDLSSALSRSSDTDESKTETKGHRKHKSSELALPQPNQRHRRSISADPSGRGDQPQYHIKNLPSFVPRDASPQKEKSSLSPYGDHVARQQEERRLQRKTSRLNDLAPPIIDTSDVSPTTSSPELTRPNTRETTNTAPPSVHASSNGVASTQGSVSDTEDLTQTASRRLNDALSISGTIGKGGLPITALAKVGARGDPVKKADVGTRRPFGSGDRPIALLGAKSSRVNPRSVSIARSMLLVPGIKAQCIIQKANAPRKNPQKFLLDAYRGAGQDVSAAKAVSRQQEAAVAAQFLSDKLKSTMSLIDASARKFRNETCHDLNARMDDLRDLASNHLTHQLHDEGDRADAFVAQLTTTHTLSIKQVNDSIDLMLRKRRQRLRYLRRAGFAILEYVLVSLMWFIWALVSIIGMARKTVGFFVAIIRWLLFLD